MNDADIVRRALKIKAQEMGTYAGDTVMDALSQMWDGVDGPMAVLRKWGLDPEKEQQFWNDFEDLLDDLKNTMPGVAVSARKKGGLFNINELKESVKPELKKLSESFGPYLDQYRDYLANIEDKEASYSDNDIVSRIAIVAGNIGWNDEAMISYPEDCMNDVLDYLSNGR